MGGKKNVLLGVEAYNEKLLNYRIPVYVFVLYLNYFVQGIATGVLGQQIMKEALVTQWGGDIVKDIGLVATVVAAAGLGRLIILPFAGPLSDKLGRKICVALGALLYAVSMFMIAKSPTMMVAYIGSLISGSANSFLDCGVIPCCVEIHTIVGAGAAAGSMDAANMLKPALARGEIQCIGATTLDEYRKNIEKDGALERRFQKVIVEPTTAEETLQILKNIKEKYEDHHNVSYTDEALEACVKLSARYITDRNFPDKAIDALDEAGSRVHLTNINVPKEIEEQEKLIEEARSLKAEAVKSQNFELAASYRDREKELSVRLEEMKVEWEARLKDDRQTVGEEEIANVISMMSGVPVQRMAQAEGLKLAGMKEELQAKVIAQDAAIEKLTKAILRSRVGLKDPNHPIGTFMFLGPTGVGKTHLAKQLAKYMFGSADALIRIDMSEYMEKYTVSRMIGAAPGYVGYEEGGQLTEKVRRKPYSIVLLDEIEKAHPDVFNILLQVLDEGRLTDNYGRTIDFKNTVIIMTSNIGTRQLKEFGRGVGFAAQNRTDDNEHSRSVIQKALNKTFAPEFLNRLDEIITFDQLSLEAITKIVDIELKGLYERVEAIGYKLVVEDDAKTFLASKGYDVQFGARPLKRAIQNHLEDGLSELIVAEELQPGDTVNVSVDKEKDELSIRKA